MLTDVLAHTGGPLAPHDLWTAWNLHGVLLLAMGTAVWAYRRGRRRGVNRRRARCFAGALAVVGVALVSPLDALSGALASAHMVQHVLLLLVAAPLLALSAPSGTVLLGSPAALRRATRRWRRSLRLTSAYRRRLRHPVTVGLLHVGTVWFWHASKPYDAAVTHEIVHAVEHVAFLLTAWVFWRVVIGARDRDRVSYGFGVLVVFAMSMQSVFLSALLTFAPTPWYSVYATTTEPWGLDPLADQQLAGVLMWVPAGLVYLAAGLTLSVAWLRQVDRESAPPKESTPTDHREVAVWRV